MTVRDAVDAVEVAKVAEAEVSLPQLVRTAVERQQKVLERILPAAVDPTRFEEMTLAAIKATKKLVFCFETLEGRTSILYAVIQAASVGLEVNTLADEAHLIPQEVGKGNEKHWEARLQFGYRGVQKLAGRDPRVKQVFGDVVRDGDHFVHRRGLEADVFEHEVIGSSDRELTHAYAVIRFHDAPAFVRVLDRAEVERRRASSQAWRHAENNQKRDSPWHVWPSPMWQKTAILAIRRELDLAPAERRALATEGQRLVDVGGDHLIAAGGELPALAASSQTAVQPPGGPPPDLGGDHPSEGPADQEGVSVPAEGGFEPVTADELRALVGGDLAAKKRGPAMRAALDAVRSTFTELNIGTIDDVAAHPQANVWLQHWIEERDHT